MKKALLMLSGTQTPTVRQTQTSPQLREAGRDKGRGKGKGRD